MQHIEVRVHDNVATIKLDRPAVHNSLSPGLLSDLQLAFSDVHQEKRARAVVLIGGGVDFCSGIDLHVLDEINRLDPDQSLDQCHQYWIQLTETIEQMLRFPKPIVAAVDGAAIGAGMALVLASDLVVMSQRARLWANAAGRGLVGGLTTTLLAFRLGAAAAARYCLTGAEMTPAQASALGLCGDPVTPDQIWVAAQQLAKSCCDGPAQSLQATKRVLNETYGESLFTQLAAAAADSASICSTESAGEGIAAFLEKRPPRWP